MYAQWLRMMAQNEVGCAIGSAVKGRGRCCHHINMRVLCHHVCRDALGMLHAKYQAALHAERVKHAAEMRAAQAKHAAEMRTAHAVRLCCVVLCAMMHALMSV